MLAENTKNSTTRNNPTMKWAGDLEGQLTEEPQVTVEPVKGCVTPCRWGDRLKLIHDHTATGAPTAGEAGSHGRSFVAGERSVARPLGERVGGVFQSDRDSSSAPAVAHPSITPHMLSENICSPQNPHASVDSSSVHLRPNPGCSRDVLPQGTRRRPCRGVGTGWPGADGPHGSGS